MHTKLTLRIEEKLIRQAKAYAKRTGKSISQIVGNYFSLLEEQLDEKPPQFSATVRSLKGILHDTGVEVKDHRRHLEEKYL